MNDLTEVLLGSLAIVLGVTALVLGGHVIREAWRDAFREPRVKPHPLPAAEDAGPGEALQPGDTHRRVSTQDPAPEVPRAPP